MYTKSGGNSDMYIFHREMEKHFSEITLARGQDYFERGLVLTAQFNGDDTISGTVAGSMKKPYNTEVYVNLEERLIYNSYCSCPVQDACKHAVALLLKFQKTNGDLIVDAGDESVDANLKKFAHLVESSHSKLRSEIAEVNRKKFMSSIAGSRNVICYILDLNDKGELSIAIQNVEIKKGGRLGEHFVIPLDYLDQSLIPYLPPDDEKVARFWKAALSGLDKNTKSNIPEEPDAIDILLKKLIATGRCHFPDKFRKALRLGPSRKASLIWNKTKSGLQKLSLKADNWSEHYEDESSCNILLSRSPWYVENDSYLAGPLETNLNAEALHMLSELPELDVVEATNITNWLREQNFQHVPFPVVEATIETKLVEAKPCLRLFSSNYRVLTKRGSLNNTDWLELSFNYPGLEQDKYGRPIEQRTSLDEEGKSLLIEKPDRQSPKKYLDLLERFGFARIYQHQFSDSPNDHYFIARFEGTWQSFMSQVPALLMDGWLIDVEPSFGHQILKPDEEWSAQVIDERGWWFSLELGIKVAGKTMPLLPILISLLRKTTTKYSLEDIEKLTVNGNLIIPLEDGNLLELPFERAKAMLSILVELYADRKLDLKKNALDLPAMDLVGLFDQYRLKVYGDGLEKLKRIASMLAELKSIPKVDAPTNLNATLRNYQLDGLSFLQYLSQNQLGGILADDMGLGKTVQTLAHLLLQKIETTGRTSLVVCPTSVLPNWIKEAKRLAPDLKVLALRGADRHNYFSEIQNYDLVVTTYPLLPRDIGIMRDRKWWCVVLDESQYIKNHQTTIAETVCELKSNHRICLTGTPVENHLGEIWSQFSFLLPGMLGSSKYFKTVFRNPIEKDGNEEMRKILAARLRPFMLRRTKQEVLSELPEKEIIVDTIEIDGKQRDLYEAVRVSMYERVKEEIARKGILKSQIIILDALLKLRQVCCHPKLLKLDTAKKVTVSSKLNYLIEKLENLLEDGRKILLFSQFTSMLDLIKVELELRNIQYVELRGDTKDRSKPVEQFQSGQVPLFLISLKAGGSGLNLTAADTVIHYDPWWNPAVEDQATDRAHRIGQTKNVFVYKLIAEGTIEERMLVLQDRKKELAAAIFDPEKAGSLKFDASDIELLLGPN